MTGFGRATLETENGRNFNIEIKSINHRYLDINVKMPRSILSLEEKIRKYIGEKLNRGKVDIFITYSNTSSSEQIVKLNTNLCDSYYSCLKEIKERYNLKDEINLSLLTNFQDIINIGENSENLDEVWEGLKQTLEKAMYILTEMRAFEGEKLKNDMQLKCDSIKGYVLEIEKRAPMLVAVYKEKLRSRLQESLNDLKVDENRLLIEIALYADKSCIDEEITRLKSHINQLTNCFNLNEPIGRKLDFIIQEMNREANTIASKSVDLEVSNLALNIKGEIEKLREQVQNIE
jgi:uncharacterized protein (TIGR00255 family)